MLSLLQTIQSKIFAKVLLSVCGSVFTILFLSFYIFEQIEYKEKLNELVKQQKFITQSQAIIVPQYILNDDNEAITLSLSGALSNPIIVGVAIMRPDGTTIYRFGDFESTNHQLFEFSHDITTFDGSTTKELGTLLTVSTERHIVEALQQRRQFYALLFAILFVTIVVAIYLSIHSIVAIPLNRLVSAIKDSKDGRPISVGCSRNNEIGLVISEFEGLQHRQFRVQSQLRDELAKREKILADLRVMKNAAEQASQTKSEFLASTSHELRTPLNAIIGFSDVIRNQMFGRVNVPAYLEYSQGIYDSGMHLLSIINDILDMSKIEAGEMTTQLAPCDLSEITKTCTHLMSGQAAERKVAVTSGISPDTPSFMGDARMMKQIFFNLLSNAIKFTPANGRVTLSACVGEYGLCVSVTDTGIGIPAEKIESVLEPFGQADSRLEREYQGTGLGLPLAKSMMELQGGTLTIHSVVDQGTTVELRFPPESLCQVRDSTAVSRASAKSP